METLKSLSHFQTKLYDTSNSAFCCLIVAKIFSQSFALYLLYFSYYFNVFL